MKTTKIKKHLHILKLGLLTTGKQILFMTMLILFCFCILITNFMFFSFVLYLAGENDPVLLHILKTFGPYCIAIIVIMLLCWVYYMGKFSSEHP
jgi:hypothetical protein